MVLKIENEEASIQGLALFFLTIIFAAAAYFWLTLPMTGGVAASNTLYWASTSLVPSAAYMAGFENIARINDGQIVAMLVMIFSALSFLIVALRSKFSVN